jgi:Na+-transporting methylmalonyl-CoA/oxaloacetate decarboxylase gamma subunit
MDTDRFKRIVLLGLGVVLIVLVIWAVIAKFKRVEDAQVVNEDVVAEQSETLDNQKDVDDSVQSNINPSVSSEVNEQLYTRQLATIAVERFGTYSTHAPGLNIEGIESLLSARGKGWVNKYKSGEIFLLGEYKGVTTKVASAEFKEWVPGVRSVVILHTHRISTDSSGEAGTTKQDAEVRLQKAGGKWWIDEIKWID